MKDQTFITIDIRGWTCSNELQSGMMSAASNIKLEDHFSFDQLPWATGR